MYISMNNFGFVLIVLACLWRFVAACALRQILLRKSFSHKKLEIPMYLFFFGYQTVKTRSKPELHILAQHLKFGWSLQTDTTTIWVFGQMPDLKKLILAGHGSFLKLALTNTDKWPIISHYKYVKTVAFSFEKFIFYKFDDRWLGIFKNIINVIIILR